MVDLHNEAVDKPLLLNDILHERMNFAIGEGIKFDYEGVASVAVWRIVFTEQSTVGG